MPLSTSSVFSCTSELLYLKIKMIQKKVFYSFHDSQRLRFHSIKHACIFLDLFLFFCFATRLNILQIVLSAQISMIWNNTSITSSENHCEWQIWLFTNLARITKSQLFMSSLKKIKTICSRLLSSSL